MNRRSAILVCLGYLLVFIGFGWIVEYAVVETRQEYRDIQSMDRLQAALPENYDDPVPRKDVEEMMSLYQDLYTNHWRHHLRERRQTLWAGMLMLLGAATIHIAGGGRCRNQDE